MKLAQSIRIGAWIFVALNLLMALGSVWVFTRMAPAIEIIIEQNAVSLHACEEMLSQLVLADVGDDGRSDPRNIFLKALNRAEKNITEQDEPLAIASIKEWYPAAFEGDPTAKRQAVAAIQQLSEINRNAMIKADLNARQVGNAGAWGVVFMAIAVFLAGVLFTRSLRKSLVEPFEEIHAVVHAIRNGDIMRRCTGANVPMDIRMVFNGINEILDRNTLSSIY